MDVRRAMELRLSLMLAVAASAAAASVALAHQYTGHSHTTPAEAQQLVQQGRALIDGGRADDGVRMLEEAASALCHVGDYRGAVPVYSEVFNIESLPLERRIRAGRMAAQTAMLRLRDYEVAKGLSGQLLDETGGLDLETKLTTHGSLLTLARGQAFQYLADIGRSNMEFETAIAMRNRLIDQCPNMPTKGLVPNAYIANAEDFIALGMRQEAVSEFDRYLERYPDAGLTVWHRRVLAHGYGWGTQEHTQLLQELWVAPAFEDDPWRYNVGRELVGSYAAGGECIRVLRYAGELIRELDALTEEELDRMPEHLRDSILTAHSEALHYLAESQLHLGFRESAIGTYRLLVSKFPDSACGRIARDALVTIIKGTHTETDATVEAFEEGHDQYVRMKKKESATASGENVANDASQASVDKGHSSLRPRLLAPVWVAITAICAVAAGLVFVKYRRAAEP